VKAQAAGEFASRQAELSCLLPSSASSSYMPVAVQLAYLTTCQASWQGGPCTPPQMLLAHHALGIALRMFGPESHTRLARRIITSGSLPHCTHCMLDAALSMH
jgi:hypothetical protein